MLRLVFAAGVLLLLAVPGLAQDVVSVPPPGAATSVTSGVSDEGASAQDEEPAGPAPCGGETITIASMQWPSAQLLAAIHARLIKQNFGCDVEIVPGDLAATASSMGSNGQPAVAPEMWITRVADVWNAALKGDNVRQAGTTYSDPVFEGWFIPDYVAAAHPEIKTVADLKAGWRVFASSGRRGRFISCPPDWGCAVINRNLLKANGLEDAFDVIEPANRFELDTLISEAESRKEPILFYYWQPNAVLAQFSFKPLDLGPFSKDAYNCLGRTACPDPKPSSFAPDPVVTAVAQWVFLDAPEVATYLARAHMPFAEMNALLQKLNEPGASVDSVADGFVADRTEIWQPWVGKAAGQ
jgi:glycine betaine/proline transport system substrate-binding protein